jgi:hypothetical protein
MDEFKKMPLMLIKQHVLGHYLNESAPDAQKQIVPK